MTSYAEVVFPLPLRRTFSYIIPEALRSRARLGTRVTAPFGSRTLTGVVVHTRARKPQDGLSLKELRNVLDDEPFFSARFLAFARTLSEYHHSSWGELLFAGRPPGPVPSAPVKFSLSPQGQQALGQGKLSGRELALAELLKDRAYTRTHVRRRLGVKDLSGLLSRAMSKGLILSLGKSVPGIRRRAPTAEVAQPTQLVLDFSLDAASREWAEAILRKIGCRAFSASYCFGPPERREAVYFFLVKNVLAEGGRALFLVPEISLGASLVERFRQRLGERAAVLHSRLTDAQKALEWTKIKSGRASVVIGPRSALFAPLENMRLALIDEEQDESFVQAESPAFDARQGLWLRARSVGAAAVLGSAVPSVGWYHRARTEGFLVSLELPARRRTAILINMAGEPGLISRRLVEAIRKQLERREPVILFLNRKGYLSSLLCARCRSFPKCPRCEIALTYHKRENTLACPYCRYEEPALARCRVCGGPLQGGRDAGLEAVEEELRRLFPQSRVVSFDSRAVRSRRDQERIRADFVKGRIDILAGTELLAHQPDLRPVALVGILNPESRLAFGDYRASQRVFQSLNRMIRPAGANPQSEIIIQSALPEHHSIRAAAEGDYRAFYEQEIRFRRAMNYPPFSSMAEVAFQGPDLRGLARQAREFQERARAAGGDVEVMGPARPSVFRLRGNYRLQVLLRSRIKDRLDEVLRASLPSAGPARSVVFFD